jgi:Transposase DDE domain
MGGFVPEVAWLAGSHGKTIVLAMDQSNISDGFACLMVSMRMGERAIPIAWKVKETSGGIGFDEQKPLLEAVFAMLPENIPVLLAGDRFYGTTALIRWCQEHGWHYRLRLRGNLILRHEGGEAAKAGMTSLLNAELNDSGVKTHIGILHEKGHPEPWIIAMSELPSKGRVLDYGMRWGIEPMFSDFKSRGFGITKTQLRHADRIERLILVLTVALYWAASTGMSPPETAPKSAQKKRNAA